ncbi:DUF3231 family protein [Pseudogracilibacillus sp. SE30717A]|uniref:DUF3231 family protein n=1 Tax=Pseudogracilibacillus sp. SE30717A TaxID=3098293 RepID=UPI00300DF48D
MLDQKQQAEPYHSGEIYHLWDFLLTTKEYLVTLQVLNNHAGDQDLKDFLDDLTENGFTPEEEQVESILSNAGIRLPPAPPDRPNVEVEDIPAGARFNDPEIASLVQKELLTGKMICSYIMGICVHEDIKNLFGEFHTLKEEYDVKLAKIRKEKGWVVSPPINIK